MKKNEIKTNGKLIIALARSYKAIHKESDAMLKSYGLTNGQFAVMEALYSKGDLTVSELIEKVLTTSGNMTVLISNLEKAGMVIRDNTVYCWGSNGGRYGNGTTYTYLGQAPSIDMTGVLLGLYSFIASTSFDSLLQL